jgi:L-ascorbate metabolism protein UlaG (beta-lactamase superfamily)
MPDKKFYLKPNLVIEPLVDNWYAWSHLISPPSAAMNILERHIKIMESYIMAPAIHAQAVKNPKMRGGPFMDFKKDRSDDIRTLLKETTVRQDNLIQFAMAIKDLDKMLESEASGYSLEKLYEKVPEILKGYVELFYDLHNRPGYRFFESLLYKSKFYNDRSQSVALWITENDHRPFCLSTPRLQEPEVLQLPIPFNHPGIDELAKMKRVPQDLNSISSLLGIAESQTSLFETFFTDTPPPAYSKYTGDKIRMRYFGHACILIETKDVSVLLDPLISYYGYDSDVDHFSDLHLPDTIDYVLITHNHQDHILFETLLPLRHRIKKILIPRTCTGKLEDPDLKWIFEAAGFQHVIPLQEMESIRFSDLTITGIPFTGEHSDLNILAKSCYLLEIGEFKLLFCADSRIIEPNLYRHIHRITGDIDVIFLGMECDGAPLTWLYGPLMPIKISREHDNSRRLSGSDCSKGMALVEIFHPREVYVYAMGQEPWVEFISSIKYTAESNPIIQSNLLVQKCLSQEIIAERLYGEKEILYEKYEKVNGPKIEILAGKAEPI